MLTIAALSSYQYRATCRKAPISRALSQESLASLKSITLENELEGDLEMLGNDGAKSQDENFSTATEGNIDSQEENIQLWSYPFKAKNISDLKI